MDAIFPPMLPSTTISALADPSCSSSISLVHRTACLHPTSASAFTLPRGGLVERSLGWITFVCCWRGDLVPGGGQRKGWTSYSISSKGVRVSDTKRRAMAETAAVAPPETSNLPPMASILRSLLAGGIAGGVYVRGRGMRRLRRSEKET